MINLLIKHITKVAQANFFCDFTLMISKDAIAIAIAIAIAVNFNFKVHIAHFHKYEKSNEDRQINSELSEKVNKFGMCHRKILASGVYYRQLNDID